MFLVVGNFLKFLLLGFLFLLLVFGCFSNNFGQSIYFVSKYSILIFETISLFSWILFLKIISLCMFRSQNSRGGYVAAFSALNQSFNWKARSFGHKWDRLEGHGAIILFLITRAITPLGYASAAITSSACRSLTDWKYDGDSPKWLWDTKLTFQLKMEEPGSFTT